MATTTVYPRLFEISTTLTSRAGCRKSVMDTATFYSSLYEYLTTPTFKALHGYLAALRESRDGRLPTLVRDFTTTAQTQTCSRFLQFFALPDKVAQLQLS